jgi:hypothetical protein
MATSILDANADHAQSHHPRRVIAQEWNSGKSADIPCGWRIVISPATEHVTLFHPFAGLARVVLVVADFKDIRDG